MAAGTVGKPPAKKRTKHPNAGEAWAATTKMFWEMVPLIEALLISVAIHRFAQGIERFGGPDWTRPSHWFVQITTWVAFAQLVLPKALTLLVELIGLLFKVARAIIDGFRMVAGRIKRPLNADDTLG